MYVCFFFFKQKTAYEMRISDWSSDVCSSDLRLDDRRKVAALLVRRDERLVKLACAAAHRDVGIDARCRLHREAQILEHQRRGKATLVIKIGRAACRERVCQYV